MRVPSSPRDPEDAGRHAGVQLGGSGETASRVHGEEALSEVVRGGPACEAIPWLSGILGEPL